MIIASHKLRQAGRVPIVLDKPNLYQVSSGQTCQTGEKFIDEAWASQNR